MENTARSVEDIEVAINDYFDMAQKVEPLDRRITELAEAEPDSNALPLLQKAAHTLARRMLEVQSDADVQTYVRQKVSSAEQGLADIALAEVVLVEDPEINAARKSYQADLDRFKPLVLSPGERVVLPEPTGETTPPSTEPVRFGIRRRPRKSAEDMSIQDESPVNLEPLETVTGLQPEFLTYRDAGVIAEIFSKYSAELTDLGVADFPMKVHEDILAAIELHEEVEQGNIAADEYALAAEREASLQKLYVLLSDGATLTKIRESLDPTDPRADLLHYLHSLADEDSWAVLQQFIATRLHVVVRPADLRQIRAQIAIEPLQSTKQVFSSVSTNEVDGTLAADSVDPLPVEEFQASDTLPVGIADREDSTNPKTEKMSPMDKLRDAAEDIKATFLGLHEHSQPDLPPLVAKTSAMAYHFPWLTRELIGAAYNARIIKHAGTRNSVVDAEDILRLKLWHFDSNAYSLRSNKNDIETLVVSIIKQIKAARD